MDEETEYCLFGCLDWCLPSSDWASWIEAIGSVAAVFAAIGLVWWERRETKRQRCTSALVVAAGMPETLEQSIAALKAIARLSKESRLKDLMLSTPVTTVGQFLDALVHPSEGEIVILSAAAPTCAAELVAAKNVCAQIRKLVDLLAKGKSDAKTNDALDSLELIESRALVAQGALERALKGLEEFVATSVAEASRR